MSEQVSRPDDFLQRVGSLVRDARRHRGLTQTGLADALGTSQSAVNRIEQGNQNLSVEMLTRISKALDSEIVSVGRPGPNHLRVTGGKRLSGRTTPSINRAKLALKMAASNLIRSRSAMGAYYRRLCARMDKPRAITATAHKLARLIYLMLTRGQEYVDRGEAYYEERHKQRVIASLRRKAASLGMQLTPAPA